MNELIGNVKQLPVKIYTIWSGEYSDRCTTYFCYTEDEAKRTCAYLNTVQRGQYRDNYYYEEQMLYTGQMAEKACYPCCVRIRAKDHAILSMTKDNNLVVVRGNAEIHPIYPKQSLYCIYCGTRINFSKYRTGQCSRCGMDIVYPKTVPEEYEVTVYVDADDDHIRKIACDTLAKYLAEENGL